MVDTFIKHFNDHLLSETIQVISYVNWQQACYNVSLSELLK